MNKHELRVAKLLDMLKNSGRLDIADVVSRLEISEATARRLFASLEEERRVIRTHGGIRLAPELEFDYSYKISAAKQSAEKIFIGKIAAGLVNSNERIFLDSGTTVLRMAEALSERIASGELKGISIVTNSLSYIDTLSNCTKVTLLGGEIRSERRDVAGSATERQLAEYFFDKVFLGADAVNQKCGLMTSDNLTAGICRIAIAHTDAAYVLADSAKFAASSFVSYASFAEIALILTDKKLEPKTKKIFVSAGAMISAGGKNE